MAVSPHSTHTTTASIAQPAFEPPLAVQFTGSRLCAWLVRRIGWRYAFDGLPTQQGVIIGYPHTSNWDFVVVMLVKWAIGLPVKFFAKDSLFRFPLFGTWLASLGAMPIDRSSPRGVVGEMVNTLQQHKKNGAYFWVGLSPEGTRKRTEGWKSGFYQLALQADVPLGFLVIDYGNKLIGLNTFMRLSGDPQADYQRFVDIYAGVRGYHPLQGSPIQPLSSAASHNAPAANAAPSHSAPAASSAAPSPIADPSSTTHHQP